MSEVKVNKITPTTNCGTVTLGDSGDTVAIPCGVTLSNSGSITNSGTITNTGTISGGTITGTIDNQVNWDTTAKTANFTAVAGNGYFVNTTSGAITLTLPSSPSAGDIVAFKDYAFTFATNNLTVDGNGSPIGGVDGTILPTYSTNGTSKTFIYVDGTKGWLVTNESTDTSQESNALYVTATGGTVTCCGDYKIHTFTGPGTFCVSCAGNACGSNSVDYLVVAGGGSGGTWGSAGGGAGGFRESGGTASGCYTTSPLGSCVSALPVTTTGYPITVGGGGAGQAYPTRTSATPGSNSSFSSITSAGGGRGGGQSTTGDTGGSGGGGYNGGIGLAGNTPPVSPPQGNNGGNSSPAPSYAGGGGGGATAVGANSTTSTAADGGAGATTNITSSPVAYSGGGGGGSVGPTTRPGGAGGTGGGGTGGASGGTNPGGAGTTNTGGGGGGAGAASAAGPCAGSGGSGGSGIVIIRYKYQ